jgi:hypothetical protein
VTLALDAVKTKVRAKIESRFSHRDGSGLKSASAGSLTNKFKAAKKAKAEDF